MPLLHLGERRSQREPACSCKPRGLLPGLRHELPSLQGQIAHMSREVLHTDMAVRYPLGGGLRSCYAALNRIDVFVLLEWAKDWPGTRALAADRGLVLHEGHFSE